MKEAQSTEHTQCGKFVGGDTTHNTFFFHLTPCGIFSCGRLLDELYDREEVNEDRFGSTELGINYVCTMYIAVFEPKMFKNSEIREMPGDPRIIHRVHNVAIVAHQLFQMN